MKGQATACPFRFCRSTRGAPRSVRRRRRSRPTPACRWCALPAIRYCVVLIFEATDGFRDERRARRPTAPAESGRRQRDMTKSKAIGLAIAATMAWSAAALAADPVTIKLGRQTAAEEPLWVMMAKPELT